MVKINTMTFSARFESINAELLLEFCLIKSPSARRPWNCDRLMPAPHQEGLGVIKKA